jgi:hypothetical protein
LVPNVTAASRARVVLVLFSQPLYSYGIVLLVLGVIFMAYALLLHYFVGMSRKGKKPQ